MFDPLNLLHSVTKREGPSPEPDSDTANRDLDAFPANASADVHNANSDKKPVNDSHAMELPPDQREGVRRSEGVESRLETKLEVARQRILQQADQIINIQTEMARQAQIYQAKITHLEGWYSTELHRMEQKLRRYVNTRIAGVHSVYSGDSMSAPSLSRDQLTTIETTYVVPDRSSASRGSQPNKVPLFLLLIAVGLALAHLLAAVIVTYTDSSSVLTTLNKTTVHQLLPAITAIIFVSGAIAFIRELYK